MVAEGNKFCVLEIMDEMETFIEADGRTTKANKEESIGDVAVRIEDRGKEVILVP